MRRKATRVRRTDNMWWKVVGEGQLTRDPSLRTRAEVERDRRIAEALAKQRELLAARNGKPQ